MEVHVRFLIIFIKLSFENIRNVKNISAILIKIH